MKRTYLAAGAVLLLGSAALFFTLELLPQKMNTQANPHAVLDKMETEGIPLIDAKDINGRNFVSTEFAGKILLINFWASWCAPCVEEFPSMLNLIRKYPGKIHLLAVSGDNSKDDLGVFLKSMPLGDGADVSIIWDQGMAITQMYGVGRIPESYIVGQDQKLIRKVVGSINWTDPDALAFFEGLLVK